MPEPTPQTIFGATIAEAPDLNGPQLQQAMEEAVDPAAAVEAVMLGGRSLPVRHVPYGIERPMLRIIAPYLRHLVDAAMIDQFDDVLAALLVEAEVDLTNLAVLALRRRVDELGELPPAPPVPEGQLPRTPVDEMDIRIVLWLEENARFEEVAEFVRQQVIKNRLADSLGKLWAPGVLGVGLLRMLNTLPPQITRALQLKFTGLPSDTASSLPTG